MESKQNVNQMMNNDEDADMMMDDGDDGTQIESFGFVNKPIERFQKPANLKPFEDPNKLFKTYEKYATEAICMLVMNYSTLNTAINVGFAGKSQQLQADMQDKVRDQDLKILKSTCGALLKGVHHSEIDSRLGLISALVDLMVYDLPNEKGGTSKLDFEECIAEYMLHFFNVQDDMDSIDDMARILFSIRNEFTETATHEQALWSEQFERLKVINEGMVGQQDQLSKFNQKLVDNESSDEEGDDAGEDNDDDEPPELIAVKEKKQQAPEKMVDDDGYEMVQQKGRRRRN